MFKNSSLPVLERSFVEDHLLPSREGPDRPLSDAILAWVAEMLHAVGFIDEAAWAQLLTQAKDYLRTAAMEIQERIEHPESSLDDFLGESPQLLVCDCRWVSWPNYAGFYDLKTGERVGTELAPDEPLPLPPPWVTTVFHIESLALRRWRKLEGD